MTLVKINLLTKNNVRNGFYLYQCIVKNEGRFFWTESIKTSAPLKASQVDVSALKIIREIQPAYYAANGIDATLTGVEDGVPCRGLNGVPAPFKF